MQENEVSLFLVSIISICACKQHRQEHHTLIQELKYSAYCMRLNTSKDSFVFYLDHYIKIDKNGNFTAMRHVNWASKPAYFTGVVNDSIAKEIDSTFLKLNYQQTYYPNDAVMYDGLDYSLDFRLNSESNKLIRFIPNYSPRQILDLSKALDALIYFGQAQQIDSFNLDAYKEMLRKYYPAPPRLVKAKVFSRKTGREVNPPKAN
jgi:hypothetical protein